MCSAVPRAYFPVADEEEAFPVADLHRQPRTICIHADGCGGPRRVWIGIDIVGALRDFATIHPFGTWGCEFGWGRYIQPMVLVGLWVVHLSSLSRNV